MSDCRFEYFDADGKPSSSYYINKAKHGEEIAQAMFIADSLKTDKIRFSTDITNDSELRTKYDHADLSKQGYKGVTGIINNSEASNVENEILNNLALSIRIREEMISAHKGVLTEEEFVYINKKESYGDIRKKVMEHFDFRDGKAHKNENEFDALIKDATSLAELQRNKGDLQHALLEQVFLAKKEAAKQGNTYFDDYFDNIALVEYKHIVENDTDKYPDGNTLSPEVITNLKSIARDLVKEADKLNAKYNVTDFEFMPEVSLKTDKIKHGGKPIQGHIDLLIYSPSTKLAHIIDYKTKSEQSFANYENTFKRMGYPFDDLPQSAENKTALQTNTYALILKEEYGITTVGNDVLLITSNFSDGDIKEKKVPGQREWRVNKIDSAKTKKKPLKDLKGLVATVLNIPSPRPLGSKSSEDLIAEMFDNKLITTVSSKTNYLNLQESKIKEKNGRFMWYNASNPSKSVNKDSKEEAMKAIGDIYDDFQVSKKKAASDLVTIFNEGNYPDGTVWNLGDNRNKAAELLQKYTSATHKLESATEIQGLGKDILVATNTVTGEVDLISVATVFNTDYNFSETEEEIAKTSIYGTIIDNKTVTKKYGKGMIPDADTHSLTHLRLALLAAELKLRDPQKYSKMTQVLSVTLSNDSPYSYSDINSQMGHLKELTRLMKKNDIEVPTELTVITEDESLSGKGVYDIDYFTVFANNMDMGSDPLKLLIKEKANLGTKDAEDLRSSLKKHVKEFSENRFNFEAQNNIEKQLAKYVQTVFGALLSKHRTIEAVYQDPLFATANRAWLSFKGWMLTENPEFKGHILGQINSLTTLGDPNAENLHLAISEYEQNSRDDIIELMTEHQQLQKELIDDSGAVGIVGSLFDKNNFKKIFSPMLEDGYEFTSDNVANWLKFKDPENKSNGLTTAQRNYIRFYAKTVKASSKTLFKKNYSLMYNDQTIEGVQKWDKYNIPIVKSLASLDVQELGFTRNSMEASLEKIQRILTKSKGTAEKSSDVVTPWKYKSLFPEQVDSDPGKGSKETRKLLNISDDNTVDENKQEVELNPITVLNMMIVESAKQEHMKTAAFASFSMQAELAYKEMYAGVDTKELRSIIGNIASLRIHNKVKEEGKIAKVLDTAKHLTAMGLFWGGVRQFATETTTAGTQLASQSIANFINKAIFKGDNKYNNKDMLWSAKMLESSLGSQIINDLGMYNTNLGEFTSTTYDETRKKLAFQTKHGFWAIKKTLQQGVQSIVLAQMHKEGVTEKTFDLDKNTGKYHYNETKDGRFYVYDENNPIEGQKTKPPTTDEEIRKHNLWLSHKETLAKEGGLNKEGRMKRPFINKHLQSMKNYSIRLLGAMDSSEIMAVEYGALGRSIMAFKRYLRQKVTNYVGTSKKSFKEGEWELTENGDYEFIEKDFEGIFQSVKGLIQDIKQHSFAYAKDNMSNARKRNLAKLMADLLLFAALYALISTLFREEWFKDSVLGVELSKGINNAASDIMPFIAVADTLEGSAMAPVSISISTSKNMYNTLLYAITGDLENAAIAGDKTLNVLGAWRTGKSILDLIVELEAKKISNK